MDLLQNPFYILNVTLQDNRQRILELSEERLLLMDSEEYAQAKSDLTNPRKRVSVEIAWLPGLGLEHTAEVIALISNSVFELLSVDKILPIAKANILAAGFIRLSEPYSSEEIAEWILELAWVFEDINLEETCSVINKERTVSGFPEVSDISVVEVEIEERRRYFRQVIKLALDKLYSQDLVKVVTMVIELTTDNGSKQAPILIDDLVDAYEVEAQDFLEKEAKNVETLITKIKQAADSRKSDSVIDGIISQLFHVIKNWDIVAQPIQVSKKSRGLDHDASYNLAVLVRNLAIHLFAKHRKLNISQRLTNLLQEVFAEVTKVSDLTEEDANILQRIAQGNKG